VKKTGSDVDSLPQASCARAITANEWQAGLGFHWTLKGESRSTPTIEYGPSTSAARNSTAVTPTLSEAWALRTTGVRSPFTLSIDTVGGLESLAHAFLTFTV